MSRDKRLQDRSIYPHWCTDTVRFSDQDAAGHVNNVAFSFFYEAGRAAIIELESGALLEPGCFFVIVTTIIDFVGELHYPGVVTVANGIERVGTSSFNVRQALFQGERCASTSTCTMVQVNIGSKTGQPLSAKARKHFEALLIDAAA